jgi:hypothetical protein
MQTNGPVRASPIAAESSTLIRCRELFLMSEGIFRCELNEGHSAHCVIFNDAVLDAPKKRHRLFHMHPEMEESNEST